LSIGIAPPQIDVEKKKWHKERRREREREAVLQKLFL